MKLITSILFLVLALPLRMYSQNCFEIIADFSGIPANPYLQELESAACSLRDTLPSEFRDRFKVFDFGFYLHSASMDGGFDASWDSLIIRAAEKSTYFVLFGREISPIQGSNATIRVKLNLPNLGSLACLKEETIMGITQEMSVILNQPGSKPYGQKEIEAMQTLGSFLGNIKMCCGGNVALRTGFDLSALEIQVDFDTDRKVKENSIALIKNNRMPTIGFKLVSKSKNLVDQCLSFEAYFSVFYGKGCKNESILRKDTLSMTLSDLKLWEYRVLSFPKINEFGQEWSAIQGGRAEVIIKAGDGKEKKFRFTIKGENPTIKEVFDFVDVPPYSNIWFWKKIMLTESGSSSKSISAPMLHFETKDPSREDLWTDWNNYSRCPRWARADDCGWGLMQLTNPVPTAQALWDWKYHIRFAYEKVLLAKLGTINSFLKSDLAIVDEWNKSLNGEFDKVEKLDTTYGGIRWKMGRSVLFGANYSTLNNYFNEPLADGERSFLDACAMLAYNGFGGTQQNASNGIPGGYKNFVFLKRDEENLKPYWTIRDNSQNYVRKASTKIIPQQ